jgi:hypothetical protein
MDVEQIASTDFVLLQAGWLVEKGRQLIEASQPLRVIVHRRDPQEYYYLFPAEETVNRLARVPNTWSIDQALDLHEYTATLVLESDEDAERAPAQCVVLKQGYPIGFCDANIPPELSLRRTGDEPAEPDLTAHSLVAELPEKVIRREIFSLDVYLSASIEPETGVTLPLALPSGAVLDILVEPQRAIELIGDERGQLVISSEAETKPLTFTLQGTELGIGRLRILAFYKGQRLCSFSLMVSVGETIATNEGQRLYQEQSLAAVSFHQPDLQLWILERTEQGMPVLTFRITAQDPALDLYYKPFGPISLRTSASQFSQDFFQGIDKLPWNPSTELRLAARGTDLFTSLFPGDLQALLWPLQGRIQTVQVLSEEPWIPWELCKLCTQDNGQVTEGPFLCEAFALTRWIEGPTPKQKLHLKNIALVVPDDSRLPSAPDERDYILSLKNVQRNVSHIPATYLEVYNALLSGQYDGWHFCGHGLFQGADPNTATMYLENQDMFTPQELSGRLRNLGKAKPLVFLNACQVGRSAMSLIGIGGWASQFLRAGAGAFVGAYWSTDDTSALNFAKNLYDRLLTGMPIGKAAQEARIAIKTAGDPTWLAYTLFADSLATVH